MKKYFLLPALLLPAAFATATDNSSYFGASYHLGKYEESGVPNASPTALKLEYGKYITPGIAVEAHATFGLAEDTVSFDGIDVDLEVKQAISLFLKGDINLTPNTNLYGLLGYTKGKLKASVQGFGSVTESDSGPSFGVGLESGVTSGIIFSAEYISYLSEDSYDYSGINLGISKKF